MTSNSQLHHLGWKLLINQCASIKPILNHMHRRFLPVNVPPTATGKRRFRMAVETDANKLVNYCCGLNYKINQPPVELKPDSEYPDWLWNLRLHPKKPSWELERGTKEYYETLHKEGVTRKNLLANAQGKTKKIVGKNLLKRLDWLHHIRFRALAHMEEDPGFDADTIENDWFRDPLRDIMKRHYYLPPEPEKVVYADKIPGNLYRKNYRRMQHSFYPRYKPEKFYLSSW